jgi:hypothetical protein
MARVLRLSGGLGRITGQFAKAQGVYDRAIGLLMGLCEEDPGNPEYRRMLASALVDRGELYHMNGRTLDAESDLRAAIGRAESLTAPPGRCTTAAALLDLAEVLTLEDRLDEARATADRAVNMLRALGVDADSDAAATARWLLSLALTARGAAAGESGDRDRAAADLAEAAGIAGAIPLGDEFYDDAQFQLATIANRRGELSRREPSSRAKAEDFYQEASRILERLIENHGQVPHYREELAETLCGRAAARLAAGRVEDAQRDCEAAVEHIDGLNRERARQRAPENPEYLSLLGRVLARRSQIELRRDRGPESRKALADAVDALTRAVDLDSARAADRDTLNRIKDDPAGWDD